MRRSLGVALAGVACLMTPHLSHTKLVTEQGNVKYTFSGLFRPETFWGNNTTSLNNANCRLDKIWFARHILDFSVGALCKLPTDCAAAEFSMTIRNKAVWGNPGTNASTNDATIKLGEAVIGSHNHTFPRHIFWMREGWLQFDMGCVLGVPCAEGHTFKIGAFPFELGRGIALGIAFAVGPETLGFYTDGLVDQFAFGGKVSGHFFSDMVTYDLYGSVWDNKSGSISDTNAKIYAQEYGRIATPARGFGKVNYTIALRSKWHISKKPGVCVACLEPYALFNSQAEQKVEFRGDASSRLGTLGVAFEYENCYGVWGFDTAFNLGRQTVKGWDRNSAAPSTSATDGSLSIRNTQVVDAGGAKIPFATAGDRQQLIWNTLQAESENGKKIGTDSTGTDLFNSSTRFRDPYTNKYKGWMFVADGWTAPFCDGVRFALGGGIASGDDNPNEETKDGDYKGFIGLQEVYTGKRIRSAFLFGGAGKPRRPLTLRNPNRQRGRFSRTVSGFTNIGYFGSALYWKPTRENELEIHSNVIGYWQPKEGRKFDIATGQLIDERASGNLGVEINTFAYYKPMPCLKFYTVMSVFLPGQHYTDIKGLPLNAEQQKFLDRLDKTGFDADRVPNLGDDLAYTINLGVSYTF